jgi:hypothetical protein
MPRAQKTRPTFNKQGYLEKCIFDGTPLSGWAPRQDLPLLSISQTRCPDTGCNTVYQRNAERNETYYTKAGDPTGWKCVEHNAEVRTITRTHSIHDVDASSLQGMGSVRQVEVPFCPKHGKAPSPNGAFLREDPFDAIDNQRWGPRARSGGEIEGI